MCPVLGPPPQAPPRHAITSPRVLHRQGHRGLAARRGEDEVTIEWLAEQARTFVDLNPEFEVPVERLATWLARLDDDED